MIVSLLHGHAQGMRDHRRHRMSTHLNDDLWMHAVLDKLLGLAQQFGCNQCDSRCAVANLGVLGPSNVYQRFSSRVDNI